MGPLPLGLGYIRVSMSVVVLQKSMPCQTLVNAILEQSPNPLTHLQDALTEGGV